MAGFTIPGGLIYLGTKAARQTARPGEPALIDPSLPVDALNAGHADEPVAYRSSYGSLTPRGRAAYLRWLSGGRCDPHVDINYVYLFFFGLERRILVDAQRLAAAQAEREPLAAEIRRLLTIYGSNGPFAHSADSLLAIATPGNGSRRYLSPPLTDRAGWHLPFELRLGVGQLIADGKPIPADWALWWVRLHPENWLRTPASRCAAEFDQVFTLRYRERFGDGLRIRPNAAPLQVSYYPASPAFDGPVQVARDIPDVTALNDEFAGLRAIGRDSCSDLDDYSRYLGRHPEAAGRSAVLALLPDSIRWTPDPASQALLRWAEDRLAGNDLAEVPAAQLLARWPAAAGGLRTKSDAVLVARLLERRGIGLEPDVRFGGPVPAGEMPVMLFRRAADMTRSPSPGYTPAAAITSLAAAIAARAAMPAGIVSAKIEYRVAATFGLGDDEQGRLRAHLARALRHPPTAAALRSQVRVLTEADLRAAGEVLLLVAGAGDGVTQTGTEALAQLFSASGLDVAVIYQHVSGLRSPDALTPLRTKGAQTPDYAIPQPASPPAGRDDRGLRLDPEVVAARLADSARAADYLAGIRAGEEDTDAALAATSHAVGAGDSNHRPAASSTAPPDSTGGQATTIIAEPAPPQAGGNAGAVTLDPDLIAARLADSARASSYLAQIFTDDDTLTAFSALTTHGPGNASASTGGLDAAHSGLLRRLAERPQWSRREFDTMIAELGLLPDGALDILNEAAVDVTGEPVCEGGDPIQLNRAAVEEMLR